MALPFLSNPALLAAIKGTILDRSRRDAKARMDSSVDGREVGPPMKQPDATGGLFGIIARNAKDGSAKPAMGLGRTLGGMPTGALLQAALAAKKQGIASQGAMGGMASMPQQATAMGGIGGMFARLLPAYEEAKARGFQGTFGEFVSSMRQQQPATQQPLPQGVLPVVGQVARGMF